MEIQELGYVPISEYLSKGPYYIPDFQRNFSWKVEDEIKELWMDLENSIREKRVHFFGQIVISNDINVRKKCIIDGQQRLCTTAILLAAFRDNFNKLNNSISEAKLDNILKDISEKYLGSTSQNPFKLVLGDGERVYFEGNILKKCPSKDIPKSESHIKMKQAYFFFDKKIKSLIHLNIDSQDKTEKIKEFYNKYINDFKIIFVETDDMELGLDIFETLNARGQNLESADLIKSHILKTSGIILRSQVKSSWNSMITLLDGADTTRFIKYFWNSQHSFSREKDLYRQIKGTVNNTNKSQELVDHLEDAASLYISLIKPNKNNYFSIPKIQETLMNIRIMKASSFYPVIIAMMQTRKFEPNDFEVVIKSIETLVFRNFILAKKQGNMYELKFSEIAKKIAENKYDTSKQIVTILKKEAINDKRVKEILMNYDIKNVVIAKYILREIENFNNSEKIVINDNNAINLEHILPQKKGKWDIADEKHMEYVNRLGNLTLLAGEYNKSISNNLFQKKKEMYNKSRIEMTKNLCSNSTWNISKIKARQKELTNMIIKRWSFE